MKQRRVSTLLLILVFFAGLSLLLYPIVSNFWNEYLQAQTIVRYDNATNELQQERYQQIFDEAAAYNQQLAKGELTEQARLAVYDDLLNPFQTGIMGYIEIPSIGCRLPMAHSTSDEVLRDSVGHLEWTSLPVGGEGTHSVLSGHRGLPSAELLTNIDHLEIGDTFSIHVLDQKLEYRVDQINVVLPTDTSKLQIETGKDYVTLLTCTPYGINSHRLLVRGERINVGDASIATQIYLVNEVQEISMLYVIPILLIAVLVSALVLHKMLVSLKRVVPILFPKGKRVLKETNLKKQESKRG